MKQQMRLEEYQDQLARYRKLYKKNKSDDWHKWVLSRVEKLKKEYKIQTAT